MKNKISSMIIMFAMIFSLISIVTNVVLSEECQCPVTENLDCSLWSNNNDTVRLGVASWSLLDGQATVTAYRNIRRQNCEYEYPLFLECGEITHSKTRGIGVAGAEDDQIDSVTSVEATVIKFNEIQEFRSLEIRSLFIEKHSGKDMFEKGDADLYLNNSHQAHFHFEAKEKIGDGNGSYIISTENSKLPNFHFDTIIFYVDSDKLCSNEYTDGYDIYSDFTVAKLGTDKNLISFIDPLTSIDCGELDNLAPGAVSGGPYVGFVGEEIVFDGSDSYDLDGKIISWRWSYTKGSSFPHYIGEGESIPYIFYEPGIYGLELKVEDDDGSESFDYTTVEIKIRYDPNGDSDGDGIINRDEDLNGDEDPTNDDSDSDGIPDYLDPDDDGDGIPTRTEHVDDGTVFGEDVDNDTIPNYLDLDSDGDGKDDATEGTGDHDGDSIPNYLDENDEDGPLGDIDGDGVSNIEDNCPEIYNPEQSDNDDDGIGNDCDDDDDNDGIPDDEDDDNDGDGYSDEDEIECGSDPNDSDSIPDDNDGDFTPDCVDEDDDNDGYPDQDENICGSDPMDPESVPLDNDGDLIADCIDEDDDNDTVPDETEDHNGDGNYTDDDNDGDGIPDYQDPDDDNDGIPTEEEDANGDNDPTNDDSDSDGIPDYLDSEDNSNNNNNNNNGGGSYNPPIIPPKNQDPVANAGGPYEEYVNAEVHFDASDSTDDEVIENYTWDFGDGAIGYGKIVTHIYSETGVFNILLIVKDNKGATGENSTTASINSLPNTSPDDPIIVGPDNGTVNSIIDFGISSTDQNDEKIRFILDWGDGNSTSTEFLPEGELVILNHSWSEPGNYTIQVQCDDGQTISGISEFEITIFEDTKDDKSTNTENLFWPITFILSLFLFIGPVGLFFRRNLYV